MLVDTCDAARLRLFVHLALAIAGRSGARLRLPRSAVDPEKGFVYLRRAGLPGKKRQTHVPISQEALDEARAAREIARTPFVIKCQSRRIGDISRAFRAAVKSAGLLDEVAPHWLRHTCATWMAQTDADLWEIEGFLGHGTLQKSPSCALPTLVDGA